MKTMKNENSLTYLNQIPYNDFFILIITFTILFTSHIFALQNNYSQSQDSLQSKPLEQIELEIDAMVVDQTMTKIGRDFYDLFYSNWEAPLGIKDYNIVIEEKPYPRLGTQITILINDLTVYQSFIQPRYEMIEEAAKFSIQATLNFLFNFEQIKKDLQGEDLKGSGIK